MVKAKRKKTKGKKTLVKADCVVCLEPCPHPPNVGCGKHNKRNPVCRRCLSEWSRHTFPGTPVRCPICRRAFSAKQLETIHSGTDASVKSLVRDAANAPRTPTQQALYPGPRLLLYRRAKVHCYILCLLCVGTQFMARAAAWCAGESDSLFSALLCFSIFMGARYTIHPFANYNIAHFVTVVYWWEIYLGLPLYHRLTATRGK